MVASRALLATCCALGAGASDTSALVQEAVRAHTHAASSSEHTAGAGALMMDRVRALARADNTSSATGGIMALFKRAQDPLPFNCTQYPKLCQEPFNCQQGMSALDLALLGVRGLAPNGKANLKTWCLLTDYQDYMTTCLQEKDLRKAGRVQYNWTTKSPWILELDASYCFIEGHCSNAAVTENTTLEESYQMCDERFGHDYWSKMLRFFGSGTYESGLHFLHPGGVTFGDGFLDPEITKLFAAAACTMGNYHCDVMYCKETYCQDPKWMAKYAHLLPKVRGDLVQERMRF